MIPWFSITQISIALIGMLLCLVFAAKRSAPNDYTMGATLLVGLLLIAQIVVAIVAPMVGNAPTGDPLEYWMYLIVALLLPFGAGFWALIDRTKWANVVLAVVHFSIAVMLFRMQVIWG
ncbi:MAG: hypothetical protein ACTHZ9_00040 [Leucobacter sp.]